MCKKLKTDFQLLLEYLGKREKDFQSQKKSWDFCNFIEYLGKTEFSNTIPPFWVIALHVRGSPKVFKSSDPPRLFKNYKKI